jgi:hypothetical protein
MRRSPSYELDDTQESQLIVRMKVKCPMPNDSEDPPLVKAKAQVPYILLPPLSSAPFPTDECASSLELIDKDNQNTDDFNKTDEVSALVGGEWFGLR